MPNNLLSPEYGLSNSKLEECTANPSDVMNGKTFYSGDKNKKTGTFSFTGNATNAMVAEGYTFYSNSSTRKSGTLLDRNTVGKNDCIGMNSTYPTVAFTYGSIPQCTTLLNGIPALAIQVPYGHYNGSTYVGAGQRAVASAIGLRADIIRSGNQILGISGTFNGNPPNFMNIDAQPSWGDGSIWTSSSIWAPSVARVTFRIRMYSTYNVDGYVRILKDGAEVAATPFNKDSTTYYVKAFSGSGNYSLNVRIDYHAGDGSIQLGGNIVTY